MIRLLEGEWGREMDFRRNGRSWFLTAQQLNLFVSEIHCIKKCVD